MHDTNITWNDVVLKNYELYTNISKELEESECQWKWYLVTLMQEDTHNKTLIFSTRSVFGVFRLLLLLRVAELVFGVFYLLLLRSLNLHLWNSVLK